MTIYQLGDTAPEIHPTAFVADSTHIIGHVAIGENASIWYGVTIRGDNERIVIGANTNIQEAAVLHSDPGYPLVVGANVSVGHQAMLHGCSVGEGSLIGIQAVVLNGARIGRNCLVGAGALVTEGKEFPDNSLIIGSPAKAVRTLSDEQIAGMHANVDAYVARGQRYATELKQIP